MKAFLSVLNRRPVLTVIIVLAAMALGILLPGAVAAMTTQSSITTVSLPNVGGGGSAGQVAFFTSSTDVGSDSNLVWDNSNKRLGVGTATPSRLLHVKGNVCLFERSSNSAGFIIERNGGDVSGYNRWVFGVDEPTGFVIKTYPWDGSTAVEQLVITKDDPSTGFNESKVGIGVTSPSNGKLEVAGGTTNAIYGSVNTPNTAGVAGFSSISNAVGVAARNTATTGNAYGLYAQSDSATGIGAYGSGNKGVYGDSTSAGGAGVYGNSSGSNGAGVSGFSNSGTGYAVRGENTSASGSAYGVYGLSDSTGGTGVYGSGFNGVSGSSSVSGGAGVAAYSNNGAGYGVYAQNTAATGSAFGVYGQSDSASGSGVYGYSSGGYGVYGLSTTGNAGYFQGNAVVTGTTTTSKVAYSAPRTHYYSVAATDFTPLNQSMQYSKVGVSIGTYVISPDDSYMYAPVHLPHGATVTSFKVFFYDNSTHNLGVYLYYSDMAGGYNNMAGAVSTGITGYGSATDTTIDFATIDNQNYSYLIDAHWENVDGSKLQIMGVVITYTINEAE